MKKLLLVALLLCGVTATSFAQLVQSTTTVTERTYGKQKKELGKIRYQGEVNIGFATGGKLNMEVEGIKEKIGTDFSRPFLETVHGVRVGDYLFAGVGVGLQHAYGKFMNDERLDFDEDEVPNWNTTMMPIFLNLKGYYPVTKHFAPYISLSLGATTTLGSDLSFTDSYFDSGYSEWIDTKLKGGFYCDFGVGFTARKFNFGFGLMHQGMKFTEEVADNYDNEHYEAKMSVTSFYVKLGLKF